MTAENSGTRAGSTKSAPGLVLQLLLEDHKTLGEVGDADTSDFKAGSGHA